VILLDTREEHASEQPDNAIIVKPYKGEPGDAGLVNLIPFLECKFAE
jgi:mitochondrial import inner membrane translocase subunit TIM50